MDILLCGVLTNVFYIVSDFYVNLNGLIVCKFFCGVLHRGNRRVNFNGLFFFLYSSVFFYVNFNGDIL